MSRSPEKPRSAEPISAPTSPRALQAQARPQATLAIPAAAPAPTPAIATVAAGGKGIVKHSSFSSSLPSDYELLRQFKQTIVSGAHPEFSAIIKPLAQKAVTVSRDEADHLWELASGDGLSGAEASELARARREAEEEKVRAAEAAVQADKDKKEADARAVEQEAKDLKTKARAETARLLVVAKEAERQRVLEESRRIKEEFRQRQLAEEAAEKAYLAQHAPLYQASAPAPAAPTAPAPAPPSAAPLPAAKRASPAPWDPRAAGANDRISLASMAKGTPPPSAALASPAIVAPQPRPLSTLPGAETSPAALPAWSQPPSRVSSWTTPARPLSPTRAAQQQPFEDSSAVPLARPAQVDRHPPAAPVVKREAAREPDEDGGNKRIRLGDMSKSAPAPAAAIVKVEPAATPIPTLPAEAHAPSLAPPVEAAHMDVDQPTATSPPQQPSHARLDLSEHLRLPTSATISSFDSHDTEADEVDALIGLLSDAPPSPPASSMRSPEEPVPPSASTRGEPSPSRAVAAATPTVALATPAATSSAPAAAKPVGEERISFASLQPSTKGSLLDRIDLSKTPRSTPAAPPSTPSTITPADDSPRVTSPVTAANLPSLLSRISAFNPFSRPGTTPLPSPAAQAVDTLTTEQAPTPLATPRSAEKPPSAPTGSQSTAPASTSVPLAHRIEHPGLAALAESLPKKPPKGLASPTSSKTHSSAARDAVQRDKDKLEHERQGLRQERKMSDAARAKREEADRARVQREEEAKRYLAAKTEQARKASTAAPAVGAGVRDADPGSLRGRNVEADADIDRGLMYDPPLGREVERPAYRTHPPPRPASPPHRDAPPPKSHAPALLGRISSPPRGRARLPSPPPRDRLRPISPPPARHGDHFYDRPSALAPNGHHGHHGSSYPTPQHPADLPYRPPPLDAYRDYTRPRSPILAPGYPPATLPASAYDPPYDPRADYGRRSAYDYPAQPPLPAPSSLLDRMRDAPAPADYYDRREYRGPHPPLPHRRDVDRSPDQRWQREQPPSARRWE